MMYTAYSKVTGLISFTVDVAREDLALAQETEAQGVVEGNGSVDLHYVKDGKLIERPQMSFVPDLVELTVGEARQITGILEGTIAVFGEERHVIEGGVLELVSEYPDDFEITFELFPYLNRTLRVIVNEA